MADDTAAPSGKGLKLTPTDADAEAAAAALNGATEDSAAGEGPGDDHADADPVGKADLSKIVVPKGHVLVRVTKKGDRKIHRGGTAKSKSAGAISFDTARLADPEDEYEVFPTFRHKDVFVLALKIAQAQEENGYVEILDEDDLAG